MQFFTDGSKLHGKVGAGVFCEALNVDIAVRLPDHCIAYQAEVIAIEEVLIWLRHNVISTKDYATYVDSQALMKSLEAAPLTSGVMLSCLSTRWVSNIQII